MAQYLVPVTLQQRRIEQRAGCDTGIKFVQAALHPGAVGQGHDTDKALDGTGGSEAQGREVTVPKELKCEGDQNSARRRRRVQVEFRSEYIECQRRPALDVVVLEVSADEKATVGRRIVSDRTGDLATVEQVLAFNGHDLESVGHLRQAEDIAVAKPFAGAAAPGEEGPHRLTARQYRAKDLQGVGLHGVNADPFSGERDGRLHDLTQRHVAKIAVCLEKPLHRPRRRNGAHANMEFLRGRPEISDDRKKLDVFVGPSLPRGLSKEVIDDGLIRERAAGRAGEQETAATEGAQHRFRDAGGAHRGEGGVERVAAVLENRGGGTAGCGMTGGDRSLAVHPVTPLILLRAVAHGLTGSVPALVSEVNRQPPGVPWTGAYFSATSRRLRFLLFFLCRFSSYRLGSGPDAHCTTRESERRSEHAPPMADKTLLPAGMVDVLPPHADLEAKTVESLMATFASYGYERVKPPLMEFEESFLSGGGTALSSQAFRLMDPISQRMLVLRPDMTMQVARIATDRLVHAPRPLRLGYAGQVAAVSATQLRPARQVGQVGVELIGASAPQADAEVIIMVASALAASGAGGLTVDLAIPTLVPALVAKSGIDGQSHHRLRSALDRKDIAGVAELAGRLGPEVTGLLMDMVALAGPCDVAMRALMALALPPAAAAERSALAQVVACIQDNDFCSDLSIDPVENRGFEYHTGVTFAVFAADVRGELGRGGRYRAGNAGDSEPATGATLFMDAVMDAVPAPARRQQRVFLPAGTPSQLGRVLREQGWIVVSGFDRTSDEEAEARRLQCSHVLADGQVRALVH